MKNHPHCKTTNQKDLTLLLEKIFLELGDNVAELLVQNELKYKNNETLLPYIADINNQLANDLDLMLAEKFTSLLKYKEA